MDALTKEKKKRLMQSSKVDLAERLLFAYSTIQSLEAEKLQLAKSLYLAANDFTSSNGAIPDWWKDCKEIARKMLEPTTSQVLHQKFSAYFSQHFGTD